SISLTGLLLPGATYQISGYVMLTGGETATSANFTIARSDPSCSGGTSYDTVDTYQVPVNGTGCAITGRSSKVSTSATGLVLYAQLLGPTVSLSFFFDDVGTTETAPP